MTLTNSLNGFDGAQELLIKLVEQSPEEWETRKRVVQVLYDAGNYRDASKLVWNAPEIPPVAEEMVFTARIVAKGQPERAVRLLSTVVERNIDSPAENLIMAKLLMKHGLTLQALRFYGAATAGDISLIDENFELAMVKTDGSDDVWKEVAKEDGFPWEGPRDIKISDIMTDEGNDGVSAAEVLLSSVTQRVPLKASVAHEAPTSAAELLLEQADADAAAPASGPMSAENSSTSILSPAAEALVNQVRSNGDASKGAETGTEDVTQQDGGSFSSLVSFFKDKESDQQMVPSSPSASTPITQATPGESGPMLAKGPVPSSSLIQDFKPTPSDALKTMVPEPAPKAPPVEEVTRLDPGHVEQSPVTQELPPAQIPPAVSQEQPEVQKSPFSPEQISQPPAANFAPPSFDATAQTPSPFSPSASPQPPIVPTPESQPLAADDLSDVVANALAERETEQPEELKSGFLSKCKGFFGKSKSKKNQQTGESDIPIENAAVQNQAPMDEAPQNVFQASSSHAQPSPPPLADQTPSASLPESLQQSAPQPMSLKAPEQPVQEAADAVSQPQEARQADDSKPISQAIPEEKAQTSTPVPRQSEAAGHAPPRELDGRTQLVALAPRDGNGFFEQLLAKYKALPEGQMSQAAAISRDMANLDYMKLIEAACAKDLNAFSKLLGLHRVMSDARCYDWVNDMDLLRKGYGDAVLATVVSKYSVEECREILSAVYQQAPATPTQAAG